MYIKANYLVKNIFWLSHVKGEGLCFFFLYFGYLLKNIFEFWYTMSFNSFNRVCILQIKYWDNKKKKTQGDKKQKQKFGQQWNWQLIIFRLVGISLLITNFKLQFYNYFCSIVWFVLWTELIIYFDTLCHSIHLIECAYYKSNIETTNNNHGNEILKWQ
jgi:hypothetical protein